MASIVDVKPHYKKVDGLWYLRYAGILFIGFSVDECRRAAMYRILGE